jgi:hypothetical protein
LEQTIPNQSLFLRLGIFAFPVCFQIGFIEVEIIHQFLVFPFNLPSPCFAFDTNSADQTLPLKASLGSV